uniref:Uncharacterized protein n=1 Tax=Fagus sylvatica TaxID=28930 RepID=A0A2N9FBN2_FAGSY
MASMVLEVDALVVLDSAGEDFSFGGFDGGEGRVGPFERLGGDGVDVGLEEEGSVCAWPGEEEERLSWSEFKDFTPPAATATKPLGQRPWGCRIWNHGAVVGDGGWEPT